ncbi:MAG TPA: siderophore-interacting protein [Marmoricola sp.]|nr:siderophore-interacting protein [Marmoricola sp.]HNI70442.1 siderophore-interacting protein [Marmoricola sp.]HNJ78557.1 siderophore-interacting protein [Marmoricola sp.]
MNPRTPHTAVVESREVLDQHLVRLVLNPSSELTTSGISDEWVGLVVPGQFQSRYYTVRSLADQLIVDVVIHSEGLVTTWASGDCVGDEVGLSEPKGSFRPAPGAEWVVLAGDLTALPAMARIAEEIELPLTIHAEAPHQISDYFPAGVEVQWHQEEPGQSRLAELVANLTWPQGSGYFWMAGESAQMREIRRFARHQMGWTSAEYDVMGYWSQARGSVVRNPTGRATTSD